MKNPDNVIVKIYELRDPRDPECKPRYVGITTQSFKKRYKMHLSKRSLIPKTYKNNWIKSLLREGVKPSIHLIEEVVGWKYACEVEKYWIKEFKEQGYKLTNGTDGGEGALGIKLSEEHRRARSKRLMGHVLSEETKAKISKAHTGYKYDDAAKLNMSKSKMGRRHSPETKLKIKLSNIGKKHTREVIERIAAMKKVPVILIYNNGEVINFECITDCAEHLNIKVPTAKSYINTSKNQNRDYKIYRKRDYVKFIELKDLKICQNKK